MFVLGGGGAVAFTAADARKTAAAWGATAEIIHRLAHDVMLNTNWEQVAEETASTPMPQPVPEPIEVGRRVPAGVDGDTVPPPAPVTDDRDLYGAEPEE